MTTTPNPVREALAKRTIDTQITNSLALHGFAFVGVVQDAIDKGPSYAHTIGLHNKGWPELFLSGNLPQETATAIMAKVVTMWTENKGPRLGRRNNFLKPQGVNKGKSWPIELEWIALDGPHGGVAELMFKHEQFFPGQPYQVVQVLWPDNNGRLPTENGYTSTFSERQERFDPAYAGDDVQHMALGLALYKDKEALQAMLQAAESPAQ